jgi:hypothetical protein
MTRAISILLAISLVSNTVVQSTENKSLAYDRVAKYECLLDAPDGELWKRRALEQNWSNVTSFSPCLDLYRQRSSTSIILLFDLVRDALVQCSQ